MSFNTLKKMNNPLNIINLPLDEHRLDYIRSLIMDVQDRMSDMPGTVKGDSELCPLKHYFADGMYCREIFIPKGVVVVGKIHKHQHPNFIIEGDVSVLTEDGGVERIKAPKFMISSPGTKRLVYAHEDTIWTTIHATDERDLEKIEEEVIAKSYEEYLQFDKDLQLKALFNIEKEIGGTI